MKYIAPQFELPSVSEAFNLATEEGQDGARVQWAQAQDEARRLEAARIAAEQQGVFGELLLKTEITALPSRSLPCGSPAPSKL